MYIINQRRDTIFNIDEARYIRLSENEVFVRFNEEKSMLIGRYETDKRASEVFEKIINEIPYTKMMEIPEE